MNRGILLALVAVPLLAQAGPKKPKKAATPPPEPTTPAPTTTPPPTPAPAGQAAGTGSGSAAPANQPAPTGPQQPPQQPTGAGGQPAGGGNGATTDVEAPPEKGADVDTLRQEYLALRDELFKSRARAHAVAGELYSTRMQIKFAWGSARYYGVSKASIRLDGATVFEDASGTIATDDGVRFDGFIAPGRHLVTFHIEAAGKDDDSFTSTTEAQITVKAVANKDLVVIAKGRDNGDIAYEWKKSERGSYGLGIDVSVKTVASSGASARRGKASK
jgi:hypothetical protein